MKKTGKKQKLKAARPELRAWVTPTTEAHYWAGLIGEVIATVGGSKRDPDMRVRFQYKRDGTKHGPEEFVFPASRLRAVKDFKARVVKNPAPVLLNPYAEYSVLEAEDVPLAAPINSRLKVSDKVRVTTTMKTASSAIIESGTVGIVVETYEDGEHLAVEFPQPDSNLHQFVKMHHSYAIKVSA